MESHLRIVSKEEAHRYIDQMPGDKVMILSYDTAIGLSNNGKFVKKKKGKKMADKALTIVLCENDPIMTLNLHDTIFTDFVEATKIKREKIFKSILLANISKIEQ